MLTLTPKAKRVVGEALSSFPNAAYRNLWSHAEDGGFSPITARIALAALGYFSVLIEIRLSEPDIPREQRIPLANDLWFVTDLMSDIIESLQEPIQ